MEEKFTSRFWHLYEMYYLEQTLFVSLMMDFNYGSVEYHVRLH